MSHTDWKDELLERNEDAAIPEGLDAAFIGLAENPAAEGVVAIYSRERCIRILMRRDNMTREDADEFFEFNVLHGAPGKFAPIFLEEVD